MLKQPLEVITEIPADRNILKKASRSEWMPLRRKVEHGGLLHASIMVYSYLFLFLTKTSTVLRI